MASPVVVEPLAEREAAYAAQVKRDLPRNYAAHLMHG